MELDVYNFKGPGIALAMYNVDEVCVLVNYLLHHVCNISSHFGIFFF